MVCRRRAEITLLDHPPQPQGVEAVASRSRPRRPRPPAGPNSLRINVRVEIIGDEKLMGARGLVVNTGHGYYTVRLDDGGKVVRKRQIALRLLTAKDEPQGSAAGPLSLRIRVVSASQG